jgi:vacuolar-type H+-ATPase subunit I/STV1
MQCYANRALNQSNQFKIGMGFTKDDTPEVIKKELEQNLIRMEDTTNDSTFANERRKLARAIKDKVMKIVTNGKTALDIKHKIDTEIDERVLEINKRLNEEKERVSQRRRRIEKLLTELPESLPTLHDLPKEDGVCPQLEQKARASFVLRMGSLSALMVLWN